MKSSCLLLESILCAVSVQPPGHASTEARVLGPRTRWREGPEIMAGGFNPSDRCEKPWENGGLMGFNGIYPLAMCYLAFENSEL